MLETSIATMCSSGERENFPRKTEANKKKCLTNQLANLARSVQEYRFISRAIRHPCVLLLRQCFALAEREALVSGKLFMSGVHQARSCKSTLPESSTLRVEPVPSEDA
jgi:hypothetical protein